MKRILLFGIGSLSNHGHQAMLEGLLSSYDAKYYYLPCGNTDRYDDYPIKPLCFKFPRPIQYVYLLYYCLFRANEKIDASVSLAGEFCDIYTLRLSIFIFYQTLFTLLIGKPVVLLGQTIGPFKTPLRCILEPILKRVSLITARDLDSLWACDYRGLSEKTKLVADLAFLASKPELDLSSQRVSGVYISDHDYKIPRCDVVISHRFHGVIESIRLGIPCVGADFSYKFNVLHRFGLRKGINYDNVVWTTINIKELRERIIKELPFVIKEAKLNATYLHDLLDG